MRTREEIEREIFRLETFAQINHNSLTPKGRGILKVRDALRWCIGQEEWPPSTPLTKTPQVSGGNQK